MKDSLKKVATIGFISKGLIYLVIGILSLLAALNLGGQSSGTGTALTFLKKQPFGQALLTALGVGLLCYSFWMFVRSIKNPEQIENDNKGKIKRIGFFITGLVYTFVAFLAFYHLFNPISENSGKSYVDFLGPSTFSIAFISIGVILAVQAVVLGVGVFRGDLLDQFNLEGKKYSQIIRGMGMFGYYARAFVVAIIAYFFLRAGLYSGDNEIKGIENAFSFLDKSTIGGILMIITAAGFVCYGVFYIMLTKYRSFGN